MILASVQFCDASGTLGSNDYGIFTLAADDTGTYTADNTQAAIQQLSAGQSLTDSFTAVSREKISRTSRKVPDEPQRSGSRFIVLSLASLQ